MHTHVFMTPCYQQIELFWSCGGFAIDQFFLLYLQKIIQLLQHVVSLRLHKVVVLSYVTCYIFFQ